MSPTRVESISRQHSYTPIEDLDLRRLKIEPFLINGVEMLRGTYIQIGDQAGNITTLVYPAGGCDPYSLFIPSLEVLTIIDLVPFISPSFGTQDRYSSILDNIFSKHKGEYIDLATLQNDPGFTEEAQNEFSAHIILHTRHQLIDQLQLGYQPLTESQAKEEAHGNFPNLLGALITMGIDLNTIKVGMFENEYRLKFFLDGKEKTIVYKTQELHDSSTRRGLEEFNVPESYYGEFTQPTAIIVKGDLGSIAQWVIDEVEPNVIIGSASASLTRISTADPRYRFLPLHSSLYSNTRWGHKTVQDIQIGFR